MVVARELDLLPRTLAIRALRRPPPTVTAYPFRHCDRNRRRPGQRAESSIRRRRCCVQFLRPTCFLEKKPGRVSHLPRKNTVIAWGGTPRRFMKSMNSVGRCCPTLRQRIDGPGEGVACTWYGPVGSNGRGTRRLAGGGSSTVTGRLSDLAAATADGLIARQLYQSAARRCQGPILASQAGSPCRTQWQSVNEPCRQSLTVESHCVAPPLPTPRGPRLILPVPSSALIGLREPATRGPR